MELRQCRYFVAVVDAMAAVLAVSLLEEVRVVKDLGGRALCEAAWLV